MTHPAALLSTTPNFTNGSGDEATTYVYDDNDRLLSEATVDHAAAPKTTITYQYGGPTNPGTQQTKKSELNHGTGVTTTTTSTYNRQGRLSTVEIDNETDATIDKRLDYRYGDAGMRVVETETDDPGQPSEVVNQTLSLVDSNNPTGYAQVLEAWEDLNPGESG